MISFVGCFFCIGHCNPWTIDRRFAGFNCCYFFVIRSCYDVTLQELFFSSDIVLIKQLSVVCCGLVGTVTAPVRTCLEGESWQFIQSWFEMFVKIVSPSSIVSLVSRIHDRINNFCILLVWVLSVFIKYFSCLVIVHFDSTNFIVTKKCSPCICSCQKWMKGNCLVCIGYTGG